MKTIISLSLLLLSFTTDACELETYAHIIKVNKVIDDSIIKNSNCSDEINQYFINLTSNAVGNINSKHLMQVFKTEFKQSIQLTPKQINVQRLSDLIEDEFQTKQFIIKNVSSLHHSSTINFDQKQSIHFICQNCEQTGRKNLKVKIGEKTIWVSANFMRQAKALRVKSDLNIYTPLIQSSDFEEISVVSGKKTQYFSDIENIKFYKVNKQLRPGDIIKVSDLTPKNLIQLGQKIKLIVKNENVQLKTTGIAQRSGRIGDYIQIKNPRSNKIITGKVIDYNKAVIE